MLGYVKQKLLAAFGLIIKPAFDGSSTGLLLSSVYLRMVKVTPLGN